MKHVFLSSRFLDTCLMFAQYRSIQAAMKRLHKIMDLDLAKEGADSDTKLKDEGLPSILLDIANYEAPNLVQYSLLLLDRYYSTESSIFQKALESRLLQTKESTDLYDLISDRKEVDIDGVKIPPVLDMAKSCWLKGEMGYEPHQINQNIILSFGK